MKILMIGDIVSEPGIRALENNLDNLINVYDIDFVIANIENASGTGIDKKAFEQIQKLNIDSYTLGNHIWSKRDTFNIVKEDKVVRPGNLTKGVPGKGYKIFEKNDKKIAVINALGRVGMNIMSDNPFVYVDNVVKRIEKETNIIILDFHAEATSEVKTMGFFMDGRVSAVLGTHTHVQTSDQKILENKTAYITDVGMTGLTNSALGMKKEVAIRRFVKCIHERYVPEFKGIAEICAVIVDIDEDTGKANSIERIRIEDK